MLTIRALTGGESYASQHLSSNDYYSEHEKVVGQWQGHGAELLGLQGEVTLEQFDAVRQGIAPESGEFLRPRQSADRFNEAGERTGTARNLYDFTVSAPKSVSVQAMVDPRLLEAHKGAVNEMAREMESLAGARVRQHGRDENRSTGNLVLAVYQHDSSRELDPQLHSHLVAANLTYDGAERRWKALQASDIYEQRAYLTEVYRNALAARVNELGYTIEDRYDAGRERGFEIQGLSAETLEKFSQRSEQRDQAIAAFAELQGRQPTNGEIAVLVRETRSDKLSEISTAEVKAQQWARLAPAERRHSSSSTRQRSYADRCGNKWRRALPCAMPRSMSSSACRSPKTTNCGSKPCGMAGAGSISRNSKAQHCNRKAGVPCCVLAAKWQPTKAWRGNGP